MSHEQMNVEREAFWTALAAAAPELGIAPSPGWEKEIGLSRDGRVRLKVSLSQDRTSVYLVGRSAQAKSWIASNLDALAKSLRTVPGKSTADARAGRWLRRDNPRACVTQRRQWPEAIDWLCRQHRAYSDAVRNLEGL